MPRQALGIIETVGLAAAVEAADTAVKSANVTLVGYELTKGGGMVMIKLQGDVGAVKAAVEAAAAAAERVNKVYSKQVIPRPHDELDKILYSKDTVGISALSSETEVAVTQEEAVQEKIQEPASDEVEKVEEIERIEEVLVDDKSVETSEGSAEVCNLCKDPECPRVKGELRTTCIHYDELKALTEHP